MRAFDNELLQALRGEQTGRVPFWEVWFMRKGKLCAGIMGGPADTVAKEIALARRLGWQHLRIDGAGAGLPRTYRKVGGGVERYSPEGALHSLDQLDEIPPLDIETLSQEVAHRVAAAHEQGLAAIAYLPWCFHAVATSMGLLNFALKSVDDIDFLHAAMEFVEERNRIALHKVMIPHGVDVVLFDGDCAYRNGLMVSPRVFRELTQQRTAETVALLQEANVPYVFHSDGKLDNVIPMLVELGFSAVHGVEAMANDLADIKHRFGDAITLMGNMDITLLGMSTTEQVREATRRMLDIGAPGGRYIAACNTSPEDFIPVQNYLAFVEEIHAYVP